MNTRKSYVHPVVSRWAMLFFLCYIFTPLRAQVPADTVSLLQLSDTHLIFSPANYDTAWIQKRINHFGKDKQPFASFFNTVPKRIGADFVVITGDLVDFYMAKKSGDLANVVGTQIEQFSSFLDKVSIVPTYLTLGNHDITSYPKDYYHQNDAGEARALWMRNATAFKNGTYYSKVVQVGTLTYRLLFLDNSYFSTYFKNKEREKVQFAMDPYQLDWLADQLQQSSTDVEIIFMHIPFPHQEKNDQGKVVEGYQEYSERTQATDLLRVLNGENAHVRLIVAGHRHINDLADFHFADNLSFTQVLTAPFGHDANNWRLIQLTKDDIIIYNTGSGVVQTVVPIN